MKLSSNDFKDLERIPALHTCEGKNISPHLSWSESPEGTKSFLLSCTDPDSVGGEFIHWLICDIPKDVKEIPQGGPLPKGAKEIPNDYGKASYGGPCPPPPNDHRYIFTIYALSKQNIKGITKRNFEEIIKGSLIDKTELIGLYLRKG